MDNRTANKICRQRNVGELRIDFLASSHPDTGWTIRGLCSSEGHPHPEWKWDHWYVIGRGETLEDAASDALSVAPLRTPGKPSNYAAIPGQPGFMAAARAKAATVA